MLACRQLCKFSMTADDVTIADALLLRFCKRAVELYGAEAITPNMHMHCHLASCIREFGPAHSFWLFPFERYNGILEGQPTNNRSIELQLMRRFQNDTLHLHLQHEAKQWPNANHFLQALPDPAYDISSPASFDKSVVPGPKSFIGSLTSDSITCLCQLYSKLYPNYEKDFQEGKVFIPSTVKKYPSITWRGKCLTSSLNKNAKNPFVFVVPPFSFGHCRNDAWSVGEERLAEVVFFLLHSVTLPNSQQPNSHLLACCRWPLLHPNRYHFGKPVQVWCRDIYETLPINRFLLASAICSRAIVGVDSVGGEHVRIAIPLVE